MISKNIAESGHLVIARFSGVVTMPEIEEYFFWVVENYGGDIAVEFSQLIYSSDLETIDIKPKDLQRISHLNSTIGRQRGSFNSAIVVNDYKYFWIAKLHKILSKNSSINTQIFRNIDDAFHWLGFNNTLAK